MLIEDVVCPVEHLADMTTDLVQLFKEHGYRDASAVGHALEGNLHLVFSQVWRTQVLYRKERTTATSSACCP